MSVTSDDVTRVLALAAAANVPARVVGQTGGNRLRIATGGRATIDLAIDDAERVWPALSSRLAPNAVILLKGSRGMRLERLVEPISKWAAQHQSS